MPETGLAPSSGQQLPAPQPAWGPLPIEDCYASAKKMAWFRTRLDAQRRRLGRPLAILDFGCGSAAHAGRYLMNDIDHYTGIDIHEPSLGYARAHFAGPRARFEAEIPEGERFDIIIACEVLEHLDHPDAVLGGLVARHLRPEGRVIGSVPNGYGLTEIEKKIDQTLGLYRGLRWLVRLARRIRGAGDPARAAAIPYNYESGHVQFYTSGQLRRVAQAGGLDLAGLVNGTLMGADLSGSTILRPGAMIRANVRIADWLPNWAAATWFFEMRRPGDDADPLRR